MTNTPQTAADHTCPLCTDLWWRAFREQLLHAGVTQPAIEAIAVAAVTALLEHSGPEDAARPETCARLARAFVQGYMCVQVNAQDTACLVAFDPRHRIAADAEVVH